MIRSPTNVVLLDARRCPQCPAFCRGCAELTGQCHETGFSSPSKISPGNTKNLIYKLATLLTLEFLVVIPL